MKKFSTQIMAEYIQKIEYKNIPKDVIEKTKLCILDSIGCALGGSTTKKGNILIKSLVEGTEGSSTIFGKKNKTSIHSALFINSSLANVMDFDDTYAGHPGASIIPMALNVGEAINASGKDVITAAALGYEIAIRIALGLRPILERKYVHGFGSYQLFGSVATTSKLIGLNSEEIANALGIAGTNAPVRSGMKEVYGQTGVTMTKNNFGIASIAGLVSTHLAKNGFKGPKDIFDGDTGFWRMVGTDNCNLGKILSKTLNKEYEILNVAFKPYPCCRLIHSSIDAVLNVVSENNIKVNDIESIAIKTISPLAKRPFTTPLESILDTIEIQGEFHGPYTIACALGKISLLDWYTNKNVLNKSLMELTKKVEFEASSSADKLFREDFGKIPATATIYVKQGKQYRNKVEIPKGEPRNPVTKEDLLKKFEMLASKVLKNENKVISLIDIIMKLEELENINELTEIVSLR